ncbi:tetratricopeptide repeat protein [Schlesneria paludicola]|uniref:tetratricopeptide repeat protein n=1 Tax=Schlesneria paludicola TaxID=360056 RepID=UPI00029AE5B8|nr:tetratricopeptide repeat protein [Schlesneria paludicola]
MDLSVAESHNRSNGSRRKATVISVVILTVSGMIAYANSYSGPLVFDDIPTIAESPSIKSLWPIEAVLFNGTVSAVGRPLVNLSFALNYAWGGLDVTSFHVTNVILHLLAALTLFGVIRRTLERPATAASLRENATRIALFCSLIWMLHPLQTESVTYVVQRSESLVGLFYFLTLYCAIRANSSPSPTFWTVAAFASCLGGVASKEVMVSAPLTVVIYDRAFSGSTFRSLLDRRRWLYFSLFSTWIPLIAFVAQGRHDSAGFGYGLSSWEYALTQFESITRYLRLAFWPDSLVLDYGVGVTRNLNVIIPAAIVVALFACGSLVAIRYQSWIAFLGFVFFASLSPSSSIIPIVTQTTAEHRMYIPLVSVTIIAVITIWQTCVLIVGRFFQGTPQSRLEWIAPSVCLSLVAISFALLTRARNFEYADPVRLWTSNILRCPDSPRPYLQIAKEYLDREPRTAINWYERASRSYELARERNRLTRLMDIQLASSHFGRGTAYSRLREFENALAEFDLSLKLDPSLVNGYFYRGMVLAQLGRDDDALMSIAKAIDLEPAPEHLFICGEILSKRKQYTAAVADLSKAIQIDASNPYFYQSRGHCLRELGHYQHALSDLSKAIQLQPNFAKALYERGLTFAAIDRHANAIEDFSKAISLSQEFAEVYLHRAKSFIRVGKVAQARGDLNIFETRFGKSAPELREQLDDVPADSATQPPAATPPQ